MVKTMQQKTGEITKGKIVRLLVYSILAFILLFNLINIPTEFNRALIYLFMFLMATVLLIIDWFDKYEILDTLTEEPRDQVFKFLRFRYRYMFIIFFFASIVYSLRVATTGLALVDAPTFEVVQFGSNTFYRAFLSGIAGLFENFFFFGVILAIIRSNIHFRLRAPFPIASFVAVFATAGVFVMYHSLVYGVTNIIATQSVFLFGFMFGALTVAFKSLVPADMLHFSNNFTIVIFRQYAVNPLAVIG